MVVSGLPLRNGNLHAAEISTMALDLLAGIDLGNENIWFRFFCYPVFSFSRCATIFSKIEYFFPI